MGNNPVSGIDPDGGFKREFWANFWNTFYGGEVHYANDKGEYFIGRQTEYTGDGVGIAYERIFEGPELVFEPSGKLDIGVQAGVKAKVWGVVDLNADVDLVSFHLLSGKANLANLSDPNSRDGELIGRNGTVVEQNLNVSAGVVNKVKVGGHVGQTFNTRNPYGSQNVDYGVYVGVPVLQPKNAPGVDLKGAGGKTFHGLDIGVGAALIIGVDVGVKIGVNL